MLLDTSPLIEMAMLHPGALGHSSMAAMFLSQAEPVAQVGTSFRDGLYLGAGADAYYGVVQVQANIKNGQLVSVKVVKFPNDRNTSRYINSQAIPVLQQEAISAQTGHVDVVSGATLTSDAFMKSLSDALQQAGASTTQTTSGNSA